MAIHQTDKRLLFIREILPPLAASNSFRADFLTEIAPDIRTARCCSGAQKPATNVLLQDIQASGVTLNRSFYGTARDTICLTIG